ncbi:MAG TPA: AMP-binding protein, partial [Candidatus Nesterenkonia stercoripullorum]|nr:AMP-binding protein [Candidatus Nesterenkonia stercoripullorum]
MKAYSAGPSDVPLLEHTIPENLRCITEKFADREVLIDLAAGRRWTYAQFREDVRRLAVGLHGEGLRPGDRVGIWGPNSWEWMLIQYATAEIGAILVTINPSYRQHELDYVLKQSGARAVFCAPAFKSQDYPAMLAATQADLDLAVVMGDPQWQRLTGTELDIELLDELAAAASPEDPINIQYTSGTTGFPKGALLTHRN